MGGPRPGHRTATEDIPDAVAKDAKFENARQNSDSEDVRVESDKATERTVLGMVRDNTQVFKLFADNPDFRRWLTKTAFRLATKRLAEERGRPAETLRGCLSAPLATTSAGYFTLLDLLIRYRHIGDSGRVDLLAGGYSAFQA